MEICEILKELTSSPGVSGCEDSIAFYLEQKLKKYGSVTVDSMNNVKCTFGKGMHFLLDAHIDEIGLIVKSITADGFIKVDKCGGIDNRMLSASEVSVWGKEEYKGIISSLPPHLQSGNDEKKVPSIDDISVDVGMTKEQAQSVIMPGDRVTFKRNFYELMSDQICSSVLDDRAGVCAVLLACEQLININAKITVLFSAQEEVDTRGAKCAAHVDGIDEAVVVDVSFGYTPACKKSDCGDIAKGVMIGVSPILNKVMSESMIRVAQSNNIPYQIEVMGGGRTGTNADAITVSKQGIKTSLLSIPQKYMHSPVEVVSISDIKATADLIVQYIKNRVGDNNA